VPNLYYRVALVLGPPHRIMEILERRIVEQKRQTYRENYIQICLSEIVRISIFFRMLSYYLQTGLPLGRMSIMVEIPKSAKDLGDVSITIMIQYGSEIFFQIYQEKYTLLHLTEEVCSSVLTDFSSLFEYILWMSYTLESMDIEVEIIESASSTVV